MTTWHHELRDASGKVLGEMESVETHDKWDEPGRFWQERFWRAREPGRFWRERFWRARHFGATTYGEDFGSAEEAMAWVEKMVRESKVTASSQTGERR